MSKPSRASKKVEGEGSYSAARRYDSDVRAFQRKADVKGLAAAARRALDGPEGAELRAAEQRGKAGKASPKATHRPTRAKSA